jgi:Xaa-Pro aminopeptidase/Xaa-Pro dipeptidase
MSTFKQRRERLLLLASKFDNVVVSNPKNLFYLTDYWGGGIGVVRPDSTILVTSVMEERRATETGREVEVVAAQGQLAMRQAVKRILASGKTLMDGHDEHLSGAVDEKLFIQARRRKDAEEVSRIKEASERIDLIYKMLEKTIRPGLTERAIASEVMKLATAEGLSPLASEGSLSPIILGSGENSAYPHVELTDRKVRVGDMVIADIFFRYHGYCSDCTRTYAVGRVSKERREGYQAVLEAERHGIEMVKVGAPGREVHEGVKDTLRKYGLDKYFTHGTGHGVGIDIHESPSLGGKSTDVLQKGDVVTVEPGIYIPGDYGVRIEDTMLVDGGAKVLTDYTRELLVL